MADKTITTEAGTTVTVTEDAGMLLVICDHPDAPEDLRHAEVGRIVAGGGFQPAFLCAFAMTPAVLRAIADHIDAVQEG